MPQPASDADFRPVALDRFKLDVETGPFGGPRLPNPVGLDRVFQAYCPPYFESMDAAVDAVAQAAVARAIDARSGGWFPSAIPDFP
jgi:hypothetical protein